MLLRFIFCFYILFSLDEFFLILFITPVYNFIINRLADESAVLKPLSLHNNRYWSDLPAFQYPCSFVPYNCKVTRRFSAHSSLFQYSTGTSTKQRNMFHPVILPYRYAKHNIYKAVSIQIIGTIMCGMVKEFWNILKPSSGLCYHGIVSSTQRNIDCVASESGIILKATLAVIFIKWE